MSTRKAENEVPRSDVQARTGKQATRPAGHGSPCPSVAPSSHSRDTFVVAISLMSYITGRGLSPSSTAILEERRVGTTISRLQAIGSTRYAKVPVSRN